jgi:hypothetical protein
MLFAPQYKSRRLCDEKCRNTPGRKMIGAGSIIFPHTALTTLFVIEPWGGHADCQMKTNWVKVLVSAPAESALGLAIILGGAPLYALFGRKEKRHAT